MNFGAVAIEQAEGGILAHSLAVGGRRFSKGTVLTANDCVALAQAGIAEVTIARLGNADMVEGQVASRLAAGLEGPLLEVTDAFNGRVNLVARADGVVTVDAAAVSQFNSVDEALTLATLPDMARVAQGQLVATLKVIPYAVPVETVDLAAGLLSAPIALHPFAMRTAALVQTRTPGFKESLIAKGQSAVETRMTALGMRLVQTEVVPHETQAVAAALTSVRADLVLILGASATSDRADVAPAALGVAGGRLTRFGMPVDPGNLLFLGEMGAAPVVGLPGCARAPALNGTDWVLERLAAGLQVKDSDIAAMGVGGLLKEVPMRAQPRRRPALPEPRNAVEVLLLAAGGSTRMLGDDKLSRRVEGEPLLRRAARAALGSRARGVHVVLDPARPDRDPHLDGLTVTRVAAPDAPEGMAASIRAGVRALPDDTAAVILAFADMPDIGPGHYDALIAAYDPEAGHAICVPRAGRGGRGHPVLFDRRFFESLTDLTGDRGAREILRQHTEFLTDVPMSDEAVLTDLDTPEDWITYQSRA